MALRKRLRFRDLVDLGITNNRPTLDLWIAKQGFPPGTMVGPNTRLWTEDEVARWLATRPTAKKANTPKSPGRPRKVRKTETQQQVTT
jgi:predicted DNA-binding transcriptional regulator AlpA